MKLFLVKYEKLILQNRKCFCTDLFKAQYTCMLRIYIPLYQHLTISTTTPTVLFEFYIQCMCIYLSSIKTSMQSNIGEIGM